MSYMPVDEFSDAETTLRDALDRNNPGTPGDVVNAADHLIDLVRRYITEGGTGMSETELWSHIRMLEISVRNSGRISGLALETEVRRLERTIAELSARVDNLSERQSDPQSAERADYERNLTEHAKQRLEGERLAYEHGE